MTGLRCHLWETNQAINACKRFKTNRAFCPVNFTGSKANMFFNISGSWSENLFPCGGPSSHGLGREAPKKMVPYAKRMWVEAERAEITAHSRQAMKARYRKLRYPTPQPRKHYTVTTQHHPNH